MSTPGVFFMSGWPWRMLSRCLRVGYSDLSKYPFKPSAAYSAGHAWPLDRMKRSLSSQSGRARSTFITPKYRQATISAAESEGAGWPSFAR